MSAPESTYAYSIGGVRLRRWEPLRMASVQLTINGEARALEIDPRQSLLDLLRERLDLTGTKKGCNQGACGACTILLDGKRILSCLTLAVMHDGADVTTIEGLAKGEALDPLQAADVFRDRPRPAQPATRRPWRLDGWPADEFDP